ncbi:MAG: hypothetical protein AB7R67_18975 [Vicinamibacterales bacterium]
MRVVAPFRPFPPESELHQQMAADGFDWMDALQMLVESAGASCRCPVHALTDDDTTLPVPTIHVATTHRRLMLWTLEACLRYLESPHFDRDTVMLDVDQLVLSDLRPHFTPHADLGLLVRTTDKHLDTGRQVLNGVQFWAHRAKKRLAAFYRRALAVAETLPEASRVWGADYEALQILVAPIMPGAVVKRHGVSVHLRQADEVIEAFSTAHRLQLDAGEPIVRSRPVLDFRWNRKRSMRAAFEALSAVGAV